MKNRQHWNTINAIQKRVCTSFFWSTGIFIINSAAIFVSSIFVNNIVKFTEINIVSVESHPILTPFIIGMVVITLYLASSLVLNISRERERGTLELLLVGPVNEQLYFAGMILAYIKVFIISISVVLIWSLASSLLINIPIRMEMFWVFIAAIFLAIEIDAFGVFVMSWGNKSKNTLILFILILLLFGAIHLSDEFISQFVVSSTAVANDPLVIIRNVLLHVNQTVSYVSPFAQFYQAVQELLNNNFINYLVKLAIMSFGTLVFLVSGVYLLKRKRGLA